MGILLSIANFLGATTVRVLGIGLVAIDFLFTALLSAVDEAGGGNTGLTSPFTVLLFLPGLLHWLVALMPLGFDWLHGPTGEIAFVEAFVGTVMNLWIAISLGISFDAFAFPTLQTLSLYLEELLDPVWDWTETDVMIGAAVGLMKVIDKTWGGATTPWFEYVVFGGGVLGAAAYFYTEITGSPPVAV